MQTGSSEKLARTARIFDLMGTDCNRNIRIILEQTRLILNGWCAIYIRIDNTPVCRIAWSDKSGRHDEESQGSAEKFPLYHAALTCDTLPFVLPDFNEVPAFKDDPFIREHGLNAFLGFPIKMGDTCVGLFGIADKTPRDYTPDEINCMKTLAAAVSLETERLTLEQELLKNKARFKEFYDATFESIFLSEKGICIDQNRTASRMFGYSRDEAMGNPGTDWIVPEDRDLVMKHMMAGVTDPYEVTALRKDGTTFPAEIQARMTQIGSRSVRITALRDVSLRKKAQAELFEEKQRYQTLVENVNDAIYILQDGHIKFANPKTIELSGYDWDELKEIPFINLVHPGDRDEILRNHIRRLKGEKVKSTYSFRVQNKGKETLWVQLNAVKIAWEEKPAVLCCIRDITRIKELEQKLRRAEKMELIGTMAGGVAHDLNNILSGLVSYPELLLMQLEKDSPLREPIGFIHDAGLKAADIVLDLLTLTRRGISIETIINLDALVAEYFNSPAHDRLKNSHPGIRFEVKSESDLLNICGSPSHISKVIMNLIINAAEAIGENGVVTVEAFNRYIDIPLKGYDTISEGDYVVLKVTDTGAGILDTDLPRIFEPFYTKKQMGRSGSGLGLSVVWNSVKDHNGYIEVRSEKDRGSVFELFFPATREKTESDPDTFIIDDFKGKGETVLVVDDVKEQRMIAKDSLKLIGYTPYTVESGEMAVDFLTQQAVDLVVLDMKMEPGIDGLETYRRILTIHPDQKAIITSGFSESDRVKKTLALGAGQYIKKPYTIKKLALALKKELHP